ncbi:hypothetical protein AVEN_203604-1 [Araneus ventricosus]|uniref:Uncharacterized protein n=1 Tax=Araneus ventricosus TaxID=182803 RepID=A0A4Y2H8W8_ARAVE|nr:hypothetical protein AVEN_12361-1 [Araneus ventricosus]GBM61969.1 hypothetical protein AVEN_47883-1 [Araneus ventricosus]GBM61988.1 hypothetical protein AVEN_61934-1 [Araneus ventricosus]GBM62077.1 hypothetical protein AVEN_203604-1 [Araneus ventricosus]
MIRLPEGSRPWSSDLQRGRDHSHQTSRGVAIMVIRPPEGSRSWSSDLQRGRDHGHQTSRGIATFVTRPPDGSRPWSLDLQRDRDHGHQTSRGITTMVIRPPELSRQNFTQSEGVGNENSLRTTALDHLSDHRYEILHYAVRLPKNTRLWHWITAAQPT